MGLDSSFFFLRRKLLYCSAATLQYEKTYPNGTIAHALQRFSWVEDRSNKPFMTNTNFFAEYFLPDMRLKCSWKQSGAYKEQNMLKCGSLLCLCLALWEKELITFEIKCKMKEWKRCKLKIYLDFKSVQSEGFVQLDLILISIFVLRWLRIPINPANFNHNI